MKAIVLTLALLPSIATAGVLWGDCRCHPHYEIHLEE
jgi:hypothetical protein